MLDNKYDSNDRRYLWVLDLAGQELKTKGKRGFQQKCVTRHPVMAFTMTNGRAVYPDQMAPRSGKANQKLKTL
jgi:hypothetical protein